MKSLLHVLHRAGRAVAAHPRRLARWALALFIAYFGGFNLWRFFTFQLGGDWCMIANSAAATSWGEFFASRVGGGPPFCFWEQHITWLLFVYVPFFWIHPTLGSVVMLLSQAAAVGFAGWLLFLLARRWLGSDWGGLLAMLLLYANPRVQKALVHDYHMLTTLPFFLTLALYLVERRRWRATWLAFVAGLLVREDAFFSMMAVPLYAAWARRRWAQAAGMTALAAAYAGVLFGVVYPYIRHGQSSYQFVSHYAWLGDSMPAIARRLLLEPHRVAWSLLTERDNRQLVAFLAQLGFLPLFSIRGWLAGAPAMSESLLSNSASLTNYVYHYVAPPAGALTVAALYTLRGWRAGLRRRPIAWRRVPVALLAVLVAGNVAYSVERGALPFSKYARRESARFTLKECRRIRGVANLHGRVPAGACVGYSFNLYSRYHGEPGAWPVRSSREVVSRPFDYLLLDTRWHRPLYRRTADNPSFVDELLTGSGWEKVDDSKGVFLLRRAAGARNAPVSRETDAGGE